MAEVAVFNGLPVFSMHCQRFIGWWLAEFRAAIPSKWQSWIRGEEAPVLLVRRDRDVVICEMTSGTTASERRFPLRLFGAAAVSAWLDECGLNREQVMAGLAID